MDEDRKVRAHFDECRDSGISFIPLVVESLGGWNVKGMDVIKYIGKVQGLRLGLQPSETKKHLFQRLSVTLWLGNANLWASRIPNISSFMDGVI